MTEVRTKSKGQWLFNIYLQDTQISYEYYVYHEYYTYNMRYVVLGLENLLKGFSDLISDNADQVKWLKT